MLGQAAVARGDDRAAIAMLLQPLHYRATLLLGICIWYIMMHSNISRCVMRRPWRSLPIYIDLPHTPGWAVSHCTLAGYV